MLISEKHKFIFIHIPKTGGSSINSALLLLDDKRLVTSEILPANIVINLPKGTESIYDWASSKKNIKSLYREPLQDYAHPFYPNSKFLCEEELKKGFFSFAFVRNPFDRIVSAFTYALRREEFEKSTDNVDPNFKFKNFSDFCHEYLANPESLNTVNRFNVHYLQQYKFIYSPINAELERGPFIDFVGKLENIKADFDLICKKIGAETTLPHTRSQNRKRPYQSFYTDETKKIVENLYAKDLNFFNYEFEPIEKTTYSLPKENDKMRIPNKEEIYESIIKDLPETEIMASTKEGDLCFNDGKDICIITAYRSEEDRLALETENSILNYGNEKDYTVLSCRAKNVDKCTIFQEALEKYESLLWVKPGCIVTNTEARLERIFEKYKMRWFIIDEQGEFIWIKKHNYSKNILKKWFESGDLSIDSLAKTLKKSDPSGFNHKFISDPAIKGSPDNQSSEPLLTSVLSLEGGAHKLLFIKAINKKLIK